MPIPVIPIAAVLGAATLGFLVGREMASGPAEPACSGGDNEDEKAKHEAREGEDAENEDETTFAWADMSRAEALRVLELEPDATPDAIREAHRRLIQRFHPDGGGSSYLAAAINRAKEVLLG